MKQLLTAMLIGLTLTGATAQQTKTLTADKHNEYGLVYTLPTTALRVEVKASRTINVAGPFWQYAKKYIGTDRVIKQDSEHWEILSVRVSSYGVANDEERYLMQLKPGATTYMSVAGDNMLLSINKEVADPTPAVETENAAAPARPRMDAYLEYVSEDFISSQSSAKRAQMLAESLMEVRDAKVSLSRGTAETMPTDGRQLELMLQSLAHQEDVFIAAFAGVEQKDTVTRVYTYIPGDKAEDVLFRMSDFAGFVEADDYSGDPVRISISEVRRAELPVNEKGEEKKLPKDAVMYMIPGTAMVSLTHDGRVLWSGEKEFAQYGMPFGLQPSLFTDRKARSFAIFDPATGAVRQIGDVDVAE